MSIIHLILLTQIPLRKTAALNWYLHVWVNWVTLKIMSDFKYQNVSCLSCAGGHDEVLFQKCIPARLCGSCCTLILSLSQLACHFPYLHPISVNSLWEHWPSGSRSTFLKLILGCLFWNYISSPCHAPKSFLFCNKLLFLSLLESFPVIHHVMSTFCLRTGTKSQYISRSL